MQSETLVGYRQLAGDVCASRLARRHPVQHHPYGAAVHPIIRARGSQERVGKQRVLVEGTLGIITRTTFAFFLSPPIPLWR